MLGFGGFPPEQLREAVRQFATLGILHAATELTTPVIG
jgi:hypothetical protein